MGGQFTAIRECFTCIKHYCPCTYKPTSFVVSSFTVITDSKRFNTELTVCKQLALNKLTAEHTGKDLHKILVMYSISQRIMFGKTCARFTLHIMNWKTLYQRIMLNLHASGFIWGSNPKSMDLVFVLAVVPILKENYFLKEMVNTSVCIFTQR